MKDHPIHLALTHAPEVEGMLLGPGQSPLDHIGVFPGEPFELRLLSATDDSVDTPDDISVALRSGGADLAWDALTPGKRRGLIYQIGTAKTDTIRSRRIAALTRTLTE